MMATKHVFWILGDLHDAANAWPARPMLSPGHPYQWVRIGTGGAPGLRYLISFHSRPSGEVVPGLGNYSLAVAPGDVWRVPPGAAVYVAAFTPGDSYAAALAGDLDSVSIDVDIGTDPREALALAPGARSGDLLGYFSHAETALAVGGGASIVTAQEVPSALGVPCHIVAHLFGGAPWEDGSAADWPAELALLFYEASGATGTHIRVPFPGAAHGFAANATPYARTVVFDVPLLHRTNAWALQARNPTAAQDTKALHVEAAVVAGPARLGPVVGEYGFTRTGVVQTPAVFLTNWIFHELVFLPPGSKGLQFSAKNGGSDNMVVTFQPWTSDVPAAGFLAPQTLIIPTGVETLRTFTDIPSPWVLISAQWDGTPSGTNSPVMYAARPV